MTREGRGPGGKLGPPPCAHGRWEGMDGAASPEREPDPEPVVADQAPESRTSGGTEANDPVFYCDLCGAEMINRHCKLACPACGYQRDCSDP